MVRSINLKWGRVMRRAAYAIVISGVLAASSAWAFDATKYADQLPEAQKKFLEAVDKARTDYGNAANEMAKGGARPARAKAVCAAIKPGAVVKDWIGEVTKLTTNGDGKGVLAISIGKDVSIATWNNAISDTGSNTLIEHDDPLFAKAAALKKKAVVKVSGRFFPKKTDCVEEKSMTLNGSMTDPEYVFRFSDVTPL